MVPSFSNGCSSCVSVFVGFGAHDTPFFGCEGKAGSESATPFHKYLSLVYGRNARASMTATVAGSGSISTAF
jgi:hypothetical protein